MASTAGGRSVGLTRSVLPAPLRRDLATMMPSGRPVTFAAGDLMISEHARSTHVLVITRGVVKITVSAPGGREVLLGLRGADELVGELSAISGDARSASAWALRRVEARVIAGAVFRSYLQTHPPLMFAVLQAVVQRLREADGRRLAFAGFDVVERVAMLLAELAQTHGRPVEGGTMIDLPISQDEIGGATGASREAVAKALRRLRARGAVATGRRQIIVQDLAALQSMFRQ
ncbi:Crp/Fnr family transcriptional regulator [Melissospora conviva]|uniref:Crp/Fnr family transcriptional regulator n=2 Tax=Melissospora conviva TaxID=3388432 RepID=UPI003B81836D